MHLKLVVEIDGNSHVGKEEYDKKRDEDLHAAGYKVIRLPFPNGEAEVNSFFLEWEHILLRPRPLSIRQQLRKLRPRQYRCPRRKAQAPKAIKDPRNAFLLADLLRRKEEFKKTTKDRLKKKLLPGKKPTWMEKEE